MEGIPWERTFWREKQRKEEATGEGRVVSEWTRGRRGAAAGVDAGGQEGRLGGWGSVRTGSRLLATGRRKGEEGAPHPAPLCYPTQHSRPSSGPGGLPRAVLAPRAGQRGVYAPGRPTARNLGCAF